MSAPSEHSHNTSEEKLNVDGGSIAIGGQAVIEGVMLRGKKFWSLAVRQPDGGIQTESHPVKSVMQKSSFYRLPLVRGVVVLIESMVIGMKALMLSTQVATGEEEKLSIGELILSIGLAVVVFLVVFKALPAILAVQLYGKVSASFSSSVFINLIEGVAKIGLFVAYLWLVSRLADVRRVFEYHGAEHKVIHAYEDAKDHGVEPLTASAQSCKKEHTRCGTSFMLLVFIISVIVFSFMGRPPVIQRILLHIALVPVVAGLSYEVIKAAARNPRSRLLAAVVAPGVWLQGLTTREPDDDQVEVALAALGELLDVEGLRAVSADGGDDSGSADVASVDAVDADAENNAAEAVASTVAETGVPDGLT